ncbi:MAG: PIN domain-containing protein [Rhodoferax sp.]
MEIEENQSGRRAGKWGRITGSETDVCSDPIFPLACVAGRGLVVLDTNIVLDLWVFNDPAAQPLSQALKAGRLRWLATSAMRDELARVLGYAHIAARLPPGSLGADGVLQAFDRHALLVDAPARAGITCSDPDDQKFIDLAVLYRAVLLSKDNAIFCMKKQLLALGVKAQIAIEFVA